MWGAPWSWWQISWSFYMSHNFYLMLEKERLRDSFLKVKLYTQWRNFQHQNWIKLQHLSGEPNWKLHQDVPNNSRYYSMGARRKSWQFTDLSPSLMVLDNLILYPAVLPHGDIYAKGNRYNAQDYEMLLKTLPVRSGLQQLELTYEETEETSVINLTLIRLLALHSSFITSRRLPLSQCKKPPGKELSGGISPAESENTCSFSYQKIFLDSSGISWLLLPIPCTGISIGTQPPRTSHVAFGKPLVFLHSGM